MMERPNIDAIEARAEAATKGPWNPCGAHDRCGFVWSEHCVVVVAHGPNYEEPFGDPFPNHEIQTRNQHFVAHARADIPALCKYVRELEAMFMPIVDKQAHWQGFEDKR